MTMETGGPLDDGGITPRTDPFVLFQEWLKQAESAEPNDPNAMALATADAAGIPNVRMVLLKGVDAKGFTFYSNAESIKGGELAANPHAAINFHWKSLRKAVRAQGTVAQRRGSRYLFRHPAQGQPDRGLGLAPVAGDGRAFRIREGDRRICAQIRPDQGAASALLDRLAPHAAAHRILARPAVPPA